MQDGNRKGSFAGKEVQHDPDQQHCSVSNFVRLGKVGMHHFSTLDAVDSHMLWIEAFVTRIKM